MRRSDTLELEGRAFCLMLSYLCPDGPERQLLRRMALDMNRREVQLVVEARRRKTDSRKEDTRVAA